MNQVFQVYNGVIFGKEAALTISIKDRLLDAAEQLFAERSYQEVSVRDLAAAADANVAAVNYHFQGKENLYNEVISRRFSIQRDRTLHALQDVRSSTQGPPKIDAVIKAFVGEYIDGALSNSFLTIVTRDMHTANAETLCRFFKEMIDPLYAAFSAALTAARPGLHPDELSWIIASVIGQMHHLILRRIKYTCLDQESEVRQMMTVSFPALKLEQDEYVRQITEHIARFSSAAIVGMYPEENND
ncbi:MAG: AcrR family transcriptional regulator [Candidatus Krumholzibacteriia bacterium]